MQWCLDISGSMQSTPCGLCNETGLGVGEGEWRKGEERGSRGTRETRVEWDEERGKRRWRAERRGRRPEGRKWRGRGEREMMEKFKEKGRD